MSADTTSRAASLYGPVREALLARGVAEAEIVRVVAPVIDGWERWHTIRDLPAMAMKQALRALHKAGVPVAGEAP